MSTSKALRCAVPLPDGRTVFGQYPGQASVRLTEHRLRDELARQLRGATEVALPYGRADVATAETVIEVEPAGQWRHAVRQTLAYAAQTGLRPAVALFGAASPADVLLVYLKLRDGKPPIALWWYRGPGCWDHVRSRTACRSMPAVT